MVAGTLPPGLQGQYSLFCCQPICWKEADALTCLPGYAMSPTGRQGSPSSLHPGPVLTSGRLGMRISRFESQFDCRSVKRLLLPGTVSTLSWWCPGGLP